MDWNDFKKLIKDNLDKKLGNKEQNTLLLSIYNSFNLIRGCILYEAFLLRINFLKNEKILKRKEVWNIGQVHDVIRGLKEDSRISDAILAEGTCIKIFCENFNIAFKLRKIGHSSGFKYSKVYPPNKFRFPMVMIKSTERIYIPLDTSSIEYLSNLVKKISHEIIYKNKKRFLLLIEKIEKLKY